MDKKHSWALEKVEMGPIAEDGGMGTSLTVFGYTENGTMVLSEEEGSEQDFFVEEQDEPIFVAQTQQGAKVLNWATNDVTPAQIERVKGGEATGDGTATPLTYEMPENEEFPELSVKVTTRTGHVIEMPRVRIKARFDWTVGKGALAKVMIRGRVLKPTKDGVKAMRLIIPLAE